MERLIGITGKAQHGKDTLANIIIKKDPNFVRKAFADPIKEAAIALDPYVRLGDDWSNVTWRLTELVEDRGWDIAKSFPDVRRLLQRLGTEVGRNMFGDDVWVNYLFGHTLASHVVISDVRYPNEADYIKSQGGIVLKVIRPNFENGVGIEHASEAQIDLIQADHDVLNDGSIADLEPKIMEILNIDYSNTRVRIME